MAKLNYPITVSLEEVGNFYSCLFFDFIPWRQSVLQDWKREDLALRAAGGDEQVVVQLSSSFLWQLQLCDGNGAMSMNMIVTTNEVLQLKYNKRENNFCSGDSLCSSMRSRHPCPSLPGICQIKMYFPYLLIIFPIFPVKIQYVCPPQVMLHRQLSNWGHICLYQVMMIIQYLIEYSSNLLDLLSFHIAEA